jgi:hypothetical protein
MAGTNEVICTIRMRGFGKFGILEEIWKSLKGFERLQMSYNCLYC